MRLDSTWKRQLLRQWASPGWLKDITAICKLIIKGIRASTEGQTPSQKSPRLALSAVIPLLDKCVPVWNCLNSLKFDGQQVWTTFISDTKKLITWFSNSEDGMDRNEEGDSVAALTNVVGIDKGSLSVIAQVSGELYIAGLQRLPSKASRSFRCWQKNRSCYAGWETQDAAVKAG